MGAGHMIWEVIYLFIFSPPNPAQAASTAAADNMNVPENVLMGMTQFYS